MGYGLIRNGDGGGNIKIFYEKSGGIRIPQSVDVQLTTLLVMQHAQ